MLEHFSKQKLGFFFFPKNWQKRKANRYHYYSASSNPPSIQPSPWRREENTVESYDSRSGVLPSAGSEIIASINDPPQRQNPFKPTLLGDFSFASTIMGSKKRSKPTIRAHPVLSLSCFSKQPASDGEETNREFPSKIKYTYTKKTSS